MTGFEINYNSMKKDNINEEITLQVNLGNYILYLRGKLIYA